jgi:hypothetical protein
MKTTSTQKVTLVILLIITIVLVFLWFRTNSRLDDILSGDTLLEQIDNDVISEITPSTIELKFTSGRTQFATITSATIADGNFIDALTVQLNDGKELTLELAQPTSIINESTSNEILLQESSTTAIPNRSIASIKIMENAITSFELADGSVGTVKLINGSISSSKLQNGSVLIQHLGNSVVTEVKLADNAVTTNKILNGTILNEDISATANISWTKISKSGSSLADIETRNATLLDIFDTGNYYTATTVEGALAEIGSGVFMDSTYLRLDALNSPVTGPIVFQNTANSTSAFRINRADGNSVFNVDTTSSGRVGIGTTEPKAKLEVVGSVIITNGSAAGGLSLGADANTVTRTSNTRKVAVINAPNFENNAQVEMISLNSEFLNSNIVSLGGRLNGSNTAATKLNFITAPDSMTTGGSIRMSINELGNVGIGTTTPGNILEARRDQDAITSVAVRNNNLTGSPESMSRFVALNGGSGTSLEKIANGYATNGARKAGYGVVLDSGRGLNLVAGGNANADMGFYTGGSTDENLRMTIASNGNVGIGTPNPSSKLEVVDNTIVAPRGITSTNIGDFVTGGSIYLRKARGTLGAETALLSNDVVGNVLYMGYDGTSYRNSSYIQSRATEDWTTSGLGSRIALWTTPNMSTTPLERVRIDHNGNVGIGTTNPAVKLHINEITNSDLIARVQNPSADANARAMLGLVNNTGGAYFFLPSSNYTGIPGDANRLILYTDVAISNGILVRPGTGGFQVSASGVNNPDLFINSSGNVGIGTTSPQSKLQIADGYLQLDLVTGTPPAADCDAANERGRMKVDPTAGSLYICMDSGWVAK